MLEAGVYIPEEWKKLDLDSKPGLFMVIGAPDTGKSTFATYLFQRLCASQGRAAFLDGDPGQSRLGPPTTITLVLNQAGEVDFPPSGRSWRKFIGSNTPSGHMLPMLVGAARLIGQAREAGYPSIVYDTSGLIDPDQGGLALKYAKVDLLQPNALVAFQIDRELEPLLHGLHLSKRTRVLPMRPSQATVERDMLRRQGYRQKSFKDYFQNARRVVLDWQQYATLLAPRFALHRLVSLEDRQGFSLGLGIVMDIDRTRRHLDLLTPLADLSAVRTIFLSDLLVSPETFKDQHIT